MRPPLYLIRHGETEWNRANRIQGWNDSPLTETGKKQARLIAGILAREIDDHADLAIYCSPLGRARQTAAVICEELGWNTARCRYDEALREMNTGDWDGLTFIEVEAAFPEDLDRFRNDSWHNQPTGGESYAMLAERIKGWLSDLPASGPAVVISHGIAGQVFRGLYLGLGEAETVSLEQPQDVVYRLAEGRLTELT